jgi:hypothetical protein
MASPAVDYAGRWPGDRIHSGAVRKLKMEAACTSELGICKYDTGSKNQKFVTRYHIN